MSFSANADMDDVCYVPVALGSKNDVSNVAQVITDKKCVRNNILTVWALPKEEATAVIDNFCRYDREVNYIYLEDGHGRLTCVLYSNTRRRIIS